MKNLQKIIRIVIDNHKRLSKLNRTPMTYAEFELVERWNEFTVEFDLDGKFYRYDSMCNLIEGQFYYNALMMRDFEGVEISAFEELI